MIGFSILQVSHHFVEDVLYNISYKEPEENIENIENIILNFINYERN